MTDTAATQTTANGHWVGRAIRRKEDPRFITGRGRFVDDVSVPGTTMSST